VVKPDLEAPKVFSAPEASFVRYPLMTLAFLALLGLLSDWRRWCRVCEVVGDGGVVFCESSD
jgi:hypothetical protein